MIETFLSGIDVAISNEDRIQDVVRNGAYSWNDLHRLLVRLADAGNPCRSPVTLLFSHPFPTMDRDGQDSSSPVAFVWGIIGTNVAVVHAIQSANVGAQTAPPPEDVELTLLVHDDVPAGQVRATAVAHWNAMPGLAHDGTRDGAVRTGADVVSEQMRAFMLILQDSASWLGRWGLECISEAGCRKVHLRNNTACRAVNVPKAQLKLLFPKDRPVSTLASPSSLSSCVLTVSPGTEPNVCAVIGGPIDDYYETAGGDILGTIEPDTLVFEPWATSVVPDPEFWTVIGRRETV